MEKTSARDLSSNPEDTETHPRAALNTRPLDCVITHPHKPAVVDHEANFNTITFPFLFFLKLELLDRIPCFRWAASLSWGSKKPSTNLKAAFQKDIFSPFHLSFLFRGVFMSVLSLNFETAARS